MWQNPEDYAEILDLGQIEWPDDMVQSLVPLAQSAPPRASPEAEEIPARLPVRAVHTNGRVRGKAFFITYSQSSIPRDVITQWFSRQIRVRRFIVGQEHHADGNLHWHVTIEYEVEKDVRAASYFNIQGEHPNIKVWMRAEGSTYEQWFLNHWKYCTKEDPTPYVVGEAPTDNRKRKRNEIFQEAVKIARQGDVNAGMQFLEENAIYDLITKYDQIRRALVGMKNSSRQNAPARALSEFVFAPTLVEGWHTLYFNGPTGLGKTQWARALLPEATVVSHRDQLRDCDFSKGVIFDDFDVGHWPPTALIHLLDWDEARGIDVKHGHVVIPAHTRKIFTHNCSFERWVSKDASEEQVAAARRRLFVVNIHTKLYQ